MSKLRKYRSDQCLNCGHEIDYSDKFCPYCGQKNSTHKLTLFNMLNEYFAGIFAYDSKLFSSVKLLFTSPGKLSKEFLSGKRIRYVNPFRFFISISIVFFILVTALPNVGLDDLSGMVKFSGDLSEGIGDQGENSLPAELFKTLEENHYLEFDDAVEQFNIQDNFKTEIQFYYTRVLYKMKHEPMAFTNYVFSKLPFFVFFYIPLFTFFSWLFYVRRPFNYTDHLVLNYNLNTVLFIFLIFTILIKSILGLNWINYFLFLFFIYLYIAFKRFYSQGYIKTFIKLFLISFVYNITSFFVILTMLTISVLFF